jgi:hypothetical protein
MAKQIKELKHIFIKYTAVSGEFEFYGYRTLSGDIDVSDEDIIDDYFRDFYGENNFDEDCFYTKAESYMYYGMQVGIKKITCKDITEEEKKTLNRLGIL